MPADRCDAISQAAIYRGPSGPCEKTQGVRRQASTAPYAWHLLCGIHRRAIAERRTLTFWREATRNTETDDRRPASAKAPRASKSASNRSFRARGQFER